MKTGYTYSFRSKKFRFIIVQVKMPFSKSIVYHFSTTGVDVGRYDKLAPQEKSTPDTSIVTPPEKQPEESSV